MQKDIHHLKEAFPNPDETAYPWLKVDGRVEDLFEFAKEGRLIKDIAWVFDQPTENIRSYFNDRKDLKAELTRSQRRNRRLAKKQGYASERVDPKLEAAVEALLADDGQRSSLTSGQDYSNTNSSPIPFPRQPTSSESSVGHDDGHLAAQTYSPEALLNVLETSPPNVSSTLEGIVEGSSSPDQTPQPIAYVPPRHPLARLGSNARESMYNHAFILALTLRGIYGNIFNSQNRADDTSSSDSSVPSPSVPISPEPDVSSKPEEPAPSNPPAPVKGLRRKALVHWQKHVPRVAKAAIKIGVGLGVLGAGIYLTPKAVSWGYRHTFGGSSSSGNQAGFVSSPSDDSVVPTSYVPSQNSSTHQETFSTNPSARRSSKIYDWTVDNALTDRNGDGIFSSQERIHPVKTMVRVNMNLEGTVGNEVRVQDDPKMYILVDSDSLSKGPVSFDSLQLEKIIVQEWGQTQRTYRASDLKRDDSLGKETTVMFNKYNQIYRDALRNRID